MAEKKRSYRDQVVEELLGHIEAGTAPWQKPWEPGKVRMAPFNPVSGKDYRGINALWLEMRGRSDPRWMTYRQAAAQDAQVRKGEKGTMIEYWKWSEREKMLDENGKPVLDDKGITKTRDVRLDRPRVFHAVVFNAEQIDGLAPYIAPEPTFSPVERAEQILKLGNVPIFHDQNDRAFYRSSTDEIHMPHPAAFKGQYEYYATALHELGHATGHGSRMAREFGPFGSEVYAKEELRAEIASYMLTTELGLGHYPERHAAYVGSWMKAIKEDRNALFAAARDAENIRTWIMEPDLRQSLIPVKAKEETKTIAQNPAVERQKENAMSDETSQAPNQDTNTERKRIYLNVPFSEKDEAKALGAKWDRRAKAWYARDDMELEPFKRWQETKAQTPEPKISPEQEFAQALKENGLILDGPPTMDGKWHRVAVEGDRKGQKSGSYRGFLEGLPAGNITNYKSGQDPVKWVATGTKIDPKELEQARAEAAARKAAQEQELRAQYRAVAKRAYGIFQNAEPAPANHAYLQNKQVPAGDLRIDQSGNLLMPMANDKGFVENIQTIHPDMALSTMGSAAGVVLSAGMEGGIASAKIPSEASSLGGMAQLVYVAELGLLVVLRIAFEIWASISLGNLMAGVYGVLLALPYIILIIVYFSQVVVSIFRVMMFSALSPILMLAVGFGWGRGMAITGVRTVFAAFMVLFGSTLALALCLYGAASLDIQNTENVREITSIDNPGLWVAIVLGWMGTAFMAEATGMANSIAGSQLTNQAAAVITAGMTATGLSLVNAAKKYAPGGASAALDAVLLGAGAARNPVGAAGAAKDSVVAAKNAVMERLKTPTFDRGGKP